MANLIEVGFKGNRKEFFAWEQDDAPPLRSAIIVEADRGEDLGYVVAIGELAEKRAAGVAHAPGPEGPARKAKRVATADEIRRGDELREQDEIARRKAMERVKANNLVMKLSDAEWQWDRKKLTIYFTAEKRVDFRTLVRDLAALFRTRIELKQIGVRDEAKRLSGIGRCGREYCSASWLPELRPVNLGVAKDQHLSLNPSQISGACGRLMCCLRYEHDFYVQSRKAFPKEGKVLLTSRGEEKVVANDIFNERVTLRNVEGEARVLSLAELKREIAGEIPVPTLEEELPMALEGLDEEIVRLQDTSERPAYRPGVRRPPDRPVPLRRRAPEPPNERSAAVPTAAPVPAPQPVEPPPSDEPAEQDAESEAGATGDAASRSARRRRGRRGGRRGRGGAGGSGSGGGDQDTPDGNGSPAS
jgi:cell fate regulator YaaT (PSP1 superfamily)